MLQWRRQWRLAADEGIMERLKIERSLFLYSRQLKQRALATWRLECAHQQARQPLARPNLCARRPIFESFCNYVILNFTVLWHF
jgi:hypothetical protein